MNYPETHLLREMPVIRRAREFHLYDTAGRRYLDLYLNGGRAVLGHRPEGFSQILKNTLSRGVYAEYPSHEEGKMLKAAKTLWGKEFPCIRYYSSSEPLYAWFREKSLLTEIDRIADPALGEKGFISYWRPWLPVAAEVRVLLPVLPVPGMETGILVCASPSISDLPEGNIPSPVSAAGLNRCLWDMKALLDRYPDFPLDPETDFSGFSDWIRRGPYLRWNGTGNGYGYGALFKKALSAGVLLPPCPDFPAILPHVLTNGDRKTLEKVFGEKGE